jgi:hypothetical protein
MRTRATAKALLVAVAIAASLLLPVGHVSATGGTACSGNPTATFSGMAAPNGGGTVRHVGVKGSVSLLGAAACTGGAAVGIVYGWVGLEGYDSSNDVHIVQAGIYKDQSGSAPKWFFYANNCGSEYFNLNATSLVDTNHSVQLEEGGGNVTFTFDGVSKIVYSMSHLNCWIYGSTWAMAICEAPDSNDTCGTNTSNYSVLSSSTKRVYTDPNWTSFPITSPCTWGSSSTSSSSPSGAHCIVQSSTAFHAYNVLPNP